MRDKLHPWIAYLWIIVGLIPCILIVSTPLSFRAQIGFSIVCFLFALLINCFRGKRVDLALITLSILISSRYIYWRMTMTLPHELSLDLLFGLLLLLAELYAFAVLILGYFQTALPLRRRPIPLPKDPSTWPTVDVYIPTYNEPLNVVRGTALAAKAMDWPKEKLNVYILDDGGRTTNWKTEAHRLRAAERNSSFRKFCREAGVFYVTRPDNSHAKAGNLNHALTKTKGEFIAIFDCDHVPTRSFLQLMLGWMIKDPKLAILQAPHHFYSPDPVEKNLNRFKKTPGEGELFYGLIQPGNDLWNATFFCGSCAVIRRKPLEDVGGIAVETVTEDAHTSLKIQKQGWSTAYIDIPQAGGLATERLSAHVGQRIRWARGMAQIFRVDNPLLGRGLSLAQRLCYSSAMLYFFYGIPRVIFLLAPLSFLWFDRQILEASPQMVLAYAFPHLLHCTQTNSRLQGDFRSSMWSEIYEVILATYIILPTTLALISPKFGSFNVTAKGGVVSERYFDRSISRPYLILALMNVSGIGIGVHQMTQGQVDQDVILFNIIWSMYNLMILLASVSVAWEDRQRREHHRLQVKLPVTLRHKGYAFQTESIDIALSGLGVLVPPKMTAELGDEVSCSLQLHGDHIGAKAKIASRSGDRLGLAFHNTSVAEEAGIVKAAFGRANVWADWSAHRKKRSPIYSLFEIMGLSLRALVELPRGLLGSKRGI